MGYDEFEREQRIAQITFAFFNQRIIEVLRERGVYIQKENWDKLR